MYTVRLEGLTSFLHTVDAASVALPEASRRAEKAAGERVLVPEISRRAPRRSGSLAGSYGITQQGDGSEVVSREPYGAGAEWGRRGKWSGFPGSPPRYAGAALDRSADRLAEAITLGIEAPLGVFGYFRRRL